MSGSQLAPFVAAAIRDKVVKELQEENKEKDESIAKLSETIRALNRVEITGPDHQPIYAQGQFETGNFGRNVNLWRVELEQVTPCTLDNINKFELWIGGCKRGGFTDNFNAEAFADDFRDSGEISISFYPGTHWVLVKTGWTQVELDESDDVPQSDIDGLIDDRLLEYFSGDLFEADPTKKCVFLDVSVSVDTNRGLVDSALGM